MKRITIVLAGLLLAGTAYADPLTGVNKFVCATSQVQICLEGDTCYSTSAWEIGVPDFVVIDLKKSLISTTKSSGEDRSTKFSTVVNDEGTIVLQGMEGGRAFSLVIDEATGFLTAAVARDGFVVSVFGVCTDTDL
ncbi:MAG: hypothetical protein WBM45_07450 [Woeseiaceae bacterium]|jgi:hypothetical protein